MLTGHVFGTYFNIQYQSSRNLHNKVYSLFDEINNSLSTYAPYSVISKVNKNNSVDLDSHFIKVFNASKKYFEQTGGAFDITIAPIVNVWGFGSGKKKQNISPKLIDSLLKLVGMDKVIIENNQIIKKHPEIQLDMSAIAKGYAVDVISEMFKKHKVENFLVEIGGELRAEGINKEQKPWSIGIDEPIEDIAVKDRKLIEVLNISSGALATSGNYRQFYYKNGKKYSHTINPKTGYPIRHNLLAVTVWATTCMKADAFATAFMVMGPKGSIKLQKSLNNIEVFLIYQDNDKILRTYTSSGFNKIIR